MKSANPYVPTRSSAGTNCRAAWGKLKVFFGACAGVGRTWAMLAEAQRLRAQGLDIGARGRNPLAEDYRRHA